MPKVFEKGDFTTGYPKIKILPDIIGKDLLARSY